MWLSIFSLSICFAKTTITCFAKTTITINNNVVEKAPYKIEAEGIYLRITFDDNSSIMSRMDDTIVKFEDPAGIKRICLPEYFILKSEVGNQVRIDGIKSGDTIILYSANGVMLSSCRSAGSSLTLDLSGYANGIYVLKVNNKSIKFTK